MLDVQQFQGLWIMTQLFLRQSTLRLHILLKWMSWYVHWRGLSWGWMLHWASVCVAMQACSQLLLSTTLGGSEGKCTSSLCISQADSLSIPFMPHGKISFPHQHLFPAWLFPLWMWGKHYSWKGDLPNSLSRSQPIYTESFHVLGTLYPMSCMLAYGQTFTVEATYWFGYSKLHMSSFIKKWLCTLEKLDPERSERRMEAELVFCDTSLLGKLSTLIWQAILHFAFWFLLDI